MDLSAYEATGSNNPNRQISVTKWNNLLSALEAADAAKAQHAADRTALAALATANPIAYLREAGREGIFKWDASDLSAEVAADTAQGIYVAPTSDTTGASGAWVRKFDGDPINAHWFGFVEGSAAGANRAGNVTAWAALQSYLVATRRNASTNEGGLYPAQLPGSYYEMDDSGTGVAFELTEGAYWLMGMTPMAAIPPTGSAGARATIIDVPAGVGGFRTQSSDTSGLSTKDGVAHDSAKGSRIDNFAIVGGFSGTEAEVHGVHLRAGAILNNIQVFGFEGDGFRLEGETGALGGSVIDSQLTNCLARDCRNGFWAKGNNANVVRFSSCNAFGNREWGFKDSGTLGNTYVSCQAAANGVQSSNDGVAIGASCVSSGDKRYGVIKGQETGASTNAPTGAATNNTWWYYISAGGVTTGFPAWSSGMTLRAGGCFHTDQTTAQHVISGCYAESAQGKAQLALRTLVHGGLLTTWIFDNTASANTQPGVLYADAGSVVSKPGHLVSSGTVTIRLGNPQGNGANRILFASEPTESPSGHEWQFDTVLHGLLLTYGGSTSSTIYPMLVTGPATLDQFGTGAAVAHAVYMPRLMVGDNAKTRANARQIMIDSAAPTSGAHGRGEIVFNRNAAVGSPIGWQCTVAGTPGTWVAMANL